MNQFNKDIIVALSSDRTIALKVVTLRNKKW